MLPEGVNWGNISSMLHGHGKGAAKEIEAVVATIKEIEASGGLPEGVTWNNIFSALHGCGKKSVIILKDITTSEMFGNDGEKLKKFIEDRKRKHKEMIIEVPVQNNISINKMSEEPPLRKERDTETLHEKNQIDPINISDLQIKADNNKSGIRPGTNVSAVSCDKPFNNKTKQLER